MFFDSRQAALASHPRTATFRAVEIAPQKCQLVHELFSCIADRYDLANHLLSGGLDYFWRRRAARIVRAWKPRQVLDLATGSGDLAISLRSACPAATVVGADFCHPMLLAAQRKSVRHLVVADGLKLPFAEQSFDVLTVAFGLRNMESWPDALVEMKRVVRVGGHLLILDFSVPEPPLRWLFRPYLHHVLPRIAALLTAEKAAYDYLGDSIEKFPHGAEMLALLKQCGWQEPTAERLSGGIVSLYTAARR